MKAKLRNTVTGDVISVTSTTDHPDCSYGQSIWVDADRAYCIVGMEPPMYEVVSASVDDRETLGQILRGARIRQGISIRKMADLAGLTPSTIQNVENGAFTPRLDIILKMAGALGLTLTLS